MITISVPLYLFRDIEKVWPTFQPIHMRMMSRDDSPGAEDWVQFDVTYSVYGLLASQYEDHFHQGAKKNKVYRIIQHNINTWEQANAKSPTLFRSEAGVVHAPQTTQLQITYKNHRRKPLEARRVESSDGPQGHARRERGQDSSNDVGSGEQPQVADWK